MRTITDEHLQAYQEGGRLQKLFDVIKEDPELSFEIRMNNKVMIYYHKDRILTISYCKGKPSIDTLSEKYYKNDTPPPVSFEDGDLIQTLRDKSQLRQYFRELSGWSVVTKWGRSLRFSRISLWETVVLTTDSLLWIWSGSSLNRISRKRTE